MNNHTALFHGPVHAAFIGSLNDTQLRALWELLVVATFADDELSLQERHDIATALRDAPSFAEAVALDTESDDIDQLVDLYRADSGALLGDIAARLGDDAARRGAFRTTAELLKGEGLAAVEASFIRELGTHLGLEPEVIDIALDT